MKKLKYYVKKKSCFTARIDNLLNALEMQYFVYATLFLQRFLYALNSTKIV